MCSYSVKNISDLFFWIKKRENQGLNINEESKKGKGWKEIKKSVC